MPGLEEVFKLSEQGVLGIFVAILVGFVYFLLQRNSGLTNQLLGIQEKRIEERDEFVKRALQIRHDLEEEIRRQNEDIRKSNDLARLEGFKEALKMKSGETESHEETS